MSYTIIFSYQSKSTTIGSNGVPFKIGDSISLRSFRAAGITGWNTSIDGSYRIVDMNSAGLSVTGGAIATWGEGSINQPFSCPPQMINNFNYSVGTPPPYSSVSSSGGAIISGAKAFNVGATGISTDWWVHAYEGPLPNPNTSPSTPPSPPTPTPTPPPPRPVVDPPIRIDDGNLLNTGGGKPPFSIADFIARASFTPGYNAAANTKGAADFRADATKAAKEASLTKAQTNKLLLAVNNAIAKGMAKFKQRPLPKPKGRRK